MTRTIKRTTQRAIKCTTSAALPCILLLALACNAAWAGDEEGFHGYIRVGAGSSNVGGPQSCYGLGGNTVKYRLGNECDADAEFGYTSELAKATNGVSFVGTIWAQAYNPHSEFSGSKLDILKAYVEAKGLDFLNGGTAWIGKRYYYRPDVHMLDFQYLSLTGTGAGLDGIKAGPGKFSYAFFKDNDLSILDPLTGKVLGTTSATRQNLLYTDTPVNANGTVDVAASIITAQGDGKHNGWQLTLLHKQRKVMGGENIVGAQYGVGPGTGIGGQCCSRIGSAGSTTLGSDVRRMRVFNSLWIQPVPHFGMEFVALVQKDKSDAGGSSTWTSLGARPVYAVAENLKLALEVGTDRVTSPTGGDAARLTKITFAPSISAGPGLFTRPELRAFVTYGKWNDAATPAINANNNAGPVYVNRTSGLSYGVHLEAWW